MAGPAAAVPRASRSPRASRARRALRADAEGAGQRADRRDPGVRGAAAAAPQGRERRPRQAPTTTLPRPRAATGSPCASTGPAVRGSTVVLFGDSHAMQLFPSAQARRPAPPLALVNLTKAAARRRRPPSCSPLSRRRYPSAPPARLRPAPIEREERPALVLAPVRAPPGPRRRPRLGGDAGRRALADGWRGGAAPASRRLAATCRGDRPATRRRSTCPPASGAPRRLGRCAFARRRVDAGARSVGEARARSRRPRARPDGPALPRGPSPSVIGDAPVSATAATSRRTSPPPWARGWTRPSAGSRASSPRDGDLPGEGRPWGSLRGGGS